jgi:hypothetical protein
MTLIAIIGNTLVFSFVICCVVSAVLQILAWSRHAKAGIPVNIRALWKPEGYFDEVGLHQIRLARRLLTLGGMAYLAYGGLLVFMSVGGG